MNKILYRLLSAALVPTVVLVCSDNALAKEKKLDDILQELGEVAEGVKTAYAIAKISKDKAIYTPIVNEIVQILQGKNVKQAVQNLLKTKDN